LLSIFEIRYFPYSLLLQAFGLPEDTVDGKALHRGFRFLAVLIHPDKVKEPDRELATQVFQYAKEMLSVIPST
jgi:hypothetical protein